MTVLLRELKKQEEKLFNCVHCGFCVPVCPTYKRLGDEADSPRGRLHFMRALVEGRISPDSALSRPTWTVASAAVPASPCALRVWSTVTSWRGRGR